MSETYPSINRLRGPSPPTFGGNYLESLSTLVPKTSSGGRPKGERVKDDALANEQDEEAKKKHTKES